MSATARNPLRRRAGLLLAACALLALGGCDPGDDAPVADDMIVAADGPLDPPETGPVDHGTDADPGDAGPPDAAPPDMAPDATPPPSAVGRLPELCVGCGAAVSPRFRLIEHGLTPVPSGPARRAASPRFQLILDP